MKKYQIFFSENLHFLVVKFSVHLNRSVFVMMSMQSLQNVTVNINHFLCVCNSEHKSKKEAHVIE